MKDPWLIDEGLGQDISDSVEEEGIAYGLGYTTGTIVSTILIDKGTKAAIGALGKGGSAAEKVAVAAGASDEFAGAGKFGNGVANSVDDVANQVLTKVDDASKIVLADDAAKAVEGSSTVNSIPKNRVDLHNDLINKGYRCNGTSEGGYVTYMHDDGMRVDIRPNGEIISTKKEWLPNNSRKIIVRYQWNGTPVPNGGHNTGEFVESIGERTFLPSKPDK